MLSTSTETPGQPDKHNWLQKSICYLHQQKHLASQTNTTDYRSQYVIYINRNTWPASQHQQKHLASQTNTTDYKLHQQKHLASQTNTTDYRSQYVIYINRNTWPARQTQLITEVNMLSTSTETPGQPDKHNWLQKSICYLHQQKHLDSQTNTTDYRSQYVIYINRNTWPARQTQLITEVNMLSTSTETPGQPDKHNWLQKSICYLHQQKHLASQTNTTDYRSQYVIYINRNNPVNRGTSKKSKIKIKNKKNKKDWQKPNYNHVSPTKHTRDMDASTPKI